jgi:HEAT repeat protein
MVTVSDDLHRALQDPGYTPPRRAFAEVVALLAHPELAERAERALLSAGLPAASYAAENLAREPSINDAPETAPALVRLVGRAARAHDAPELLAALSRALHSPHAETRRQAAMALGKSGRAEAEPALLACLDTTDAKLLRSVIEALGKVGGDAALVRLRSFEPPETLRQVVERARLILERGALRLGAEGVEQPINMTRPLPERLTIVRSNAAPACRHF